LDQIKLLKRPWIPGKSDMSEILNAPNPILSIEAEPITKFDKNLDNLLKDMQQALISAHDPIGVGLAAPQIGVEKRVFITKAGEKAKIEIFINPIVLSFEPIKKTKKKRIRKLEGCLSLVGIWGEVDRYPKITLEWQDEKGKKNVKKFNGFMATIIQHEIDHLEGILFPKRVLEQKGKLYKSRKNEKGEDVFEEIDV